MSPCLLPAPFYLNKNCVESGANISRLWVECSVTRWWNKKLPNFPQKVATHFLHNRDIIRNSPKGNQIFWLLLWTNLLPRTCKSCQIWSHLTSMLREVCRWLRLKEIRIVWFDALEWLGRFVLKRCSMEGTYLLTYLLLQMVLSILSWSTTTHCDLSRKPTRKVIYIVIKHNESSFCKTHYKRTNST